ncbi:MAG TPA: hypothetical protein VM677_17655 [Actinokineospora sp.]|nr:hypothetical protein [Actinokineospora sp.]
MQTAALGKQGWTAAITVPADAMGEPGMGQVTIRAASPPILGLVFHGPAVFSLTPAQWVGYRAALDAAMVAVGQVNHVALARR